MCGIAGIVAPSGWTKQALQDAATAMAVSLHHRGPDAQGVWLDSQIPLALSHRRLAIQDLSPAGHQPMASASGRFHIVFNGEIYNFRILADELRLLGHHFRGHSDTEVFLAAIEEWGVAVALQRSHGMFALVVWDKQSRELILCRDRMGEKPLFFGWLENCFVFASELKALHCIFKSALTVDFGARAAYFRFGYVPTPYSIYRNVFKLLPGTFLRIPVSPLPALSTFNPLSGKGELSPQPYWSLEAIAREGLANPIYDTNEATDQLDRLLRDTISNQMIADVPLGAFLSGGVDSSLIAAVMQTVSTKPIKTFTIGFKEKEFDEAPYARAIAKHIGSDHYEYYISANDGLDLIGDIPKYWDEPFADASQIPTLMVAKTAQREVTVCLTGDGGDELFCGYNRYFSTSSFFSKQNRLPIGTRKVIADAVSAISPNAYQSTYAILSRLTGNRPTQANVGLKIHKLAGLMRTKSLHEAYRYLMSYWQEPNDIFCQKQKEVESIIDRQNIPGMGHFILDAMYWDQLGYLVDDNLVKGDRASMAVSLESRLPLLDHRIVELSWRLPLEMKYHGGQSKWLLRQVLYRYVPKGLIERPKMGFSVPIAKWLRGPLKKWAEEILQPSNISADSFMNHHKVESLWSQHQNGNCDHSHMLWTLLIWLTWLNQQN